MLRKVRRIAGSPGCACLTQRQLAELVRYDRAWLGRAERGRCLLPEDQAAALDALFGTQGLPWQCGPAAYRM
ncbi:helix-turn-helix transcriptional regulator [Nonomuraea sp. NPDC049695]|uniref:helix-turn-helix domain-containing protein n=1 Tax=Nonomuraea sp. NPDC049695 TaxID=3154734 RepID=UPI003439FFAC